MVGNGLRASLVAKPTESELPRIAGLAALLAMLPSALAVLVQQAGGLRELVPILALIVLVTLAVFAWGVPRRWAWTRRGRAKSPWPFPVWACSPSCCSGPDSRPCSLPAASSSGWTQLDVPEDRRLALAAIRTGAASIVLYILLSLADLVAATPGYYSARA